MVPPRKQGMKRQSRKKSKMVFKATQSWKQAIMVAEWALANAYKQIGEDAKSTEMLARCKANVPYGIMLHKMA